MRGSQATNVLSHAESKTLQILRFRYLSFSKRLGCVYYCFVMILLLQTELKPGPKKYAMPYEAETKQFSLEAPVFSFEIGSCFVKLAWTYREPRKASQALRVRLLRHQPLTSKVLVQRPDRSKQAASRDGDRFKEANGVFVARRNKAIVCFLSVRAVGCSFSRLMPVSKGCGFTSRN